MPGCTGDLEKDARFTRSSKWGIVCFVAAALCLIGGDRWSVPILSQAGVLLLGGVFIFLGLDSISTRIHTCGSRKLKAVETLTNSPTLSQPPELTPAGGNGHTRNPVNPTRQYHRQLSNSW